MKGVRATKYVFVTGGVISGLGKGLVAASLGRILVARGLRVTNLKLDPYLNVDPGTMNPLEHGEVYVTRDGAETDLDLGHYERFVGVNLSGAASVTAGSVYQSVLRKERRGEYLGETVQVVPHVTDEIRDRLRRAAPAGGSAEAADVVIVEVGGTVGDIEGLPFLEAVRQFAGEVGRQRVLFIHVSWVPYLEAAGEMKSKPTQHSASELRARGISPDVVVVRSEREVDQGVMAKIALFCDVAPEAVIAAPDVDDIYRVPLVLEAGGLGTVVSSKLGLETCPAELGGWEAMCQRRREGREAEAKVAVGVVGKYVALPDAYLSLSEAIRHAGEAEECGVEISFIDAEEVGGLMVGEKLGDLDAIIVAGGFGDRGVEGKIEAVRYAREEGIPFLGICLGLQCAVIEYARHVAGLDGANSREFDEKTPYPVVDLMSAQRDVGEKGATMRLGTWPAKLREGSVVRELYGEEVVYERHRHRYEVSNTYRDQLEKAGLVASGTSLDGELVEFVELESHPFFVATQSHPEFESRPGVGHPLFRGLVRAGSARD